jgi:hypothetical protein
MKRGRASVESADAEEADDANDLNEEHVWARIMSCKRIRRLKK